MLLAATLVSFAIAANLGWPQRAEPVRTRRAELQLPDEGDDEERAPWISLGMITPCIPERQSADRPLAAAQAAASAPRRSAGKIASCREFP